MEATDIQVVTGSDAFILTNPTFDKHLNISHPSGKEFRLTITIAFEECMFGSATMLSCLRDAHSSSPSRCNGHGQPSMAQG